MKKIIDSNGRLFGRLSVIDLGVIAVIVVLAAALYMKFNVMELSSPTVSSDTVIEYQITVNNMPQGRLESLRVGDSIYDQDNGTGASVGTITDIQYTDCTIPSSLVDGTYVMGTVDERFNVVISVQGSGRVDQTAGRYYLNRTIEVAVGQTTNFYTKACLFAGTVTQLQ